MERFAELWRLRRLGELWGVGVGNRAWAQKGVLALHSHASSNSSGKEQHEPPKPKSPEP